jgi:hypothetical protein
MQYMCTSNWDSTVYESCHVSIWVMSLYESCLSQVTETQPSMSHVMSLYESCRYISHVSMTMCTQKKSQSYLICFMIRMGCIIKLVLYHVLWWECAVSCFMSRMGWECAISCFMIRMCCFIVCSNMFYDKIY